MYIIDIEFAMSFVKPYGRDFKLEYGGKIFFGGVFDKRAGMLFAARNYEDGNVHGSDGVSKTVIKNIAGRFF